MKINIGGHRGSGTTDSDHAQKRNIAAPKPPENTLQSIQHAFEQGADFVEVDVIQTLDNHLAVCHSNLLSDHVFNLNTPQFIGDKTLAELRNLRVGANSDGIIPTLKEVLETVKHYRQKNKNIRLNIEIKDVKNTNACKFRAGQPDLITLLAEEIAGCESWIVLSSFALSDLMAAQKIMPSVKRGMLFITNSMKEEIIYPNDAQDTSQMMRFTTDNIKRVCECAAVDFLHPDIRDLNEETCRLAKNLNLGINGWMFEEPFPFAYQSIIQNALQLTKKHGIPFGMITDFVPTWRKVVMES